MTLTGQKHEQTGMLQSILKNIMVLIGLFMRSLIIHLAIFQEDKIDCYEKEFYYFNI